MNSAHALSRIILFLCLICKVPLTAQTMGVSLLEYSDSDKKVAVIHDMHSDACITDFISENSRVYLDRQSDEIQRLTEKLKASLCKTTYVVEYADELKKHKKYYKIGRVLGNNLKLIDENGWRQGCIDFMSCDKRDSIMTYWFNCYGFFARYHEIPERDRAGLKEKFRSLSPTMQEVLNNIEQRRKLLLNMLNDLEISIKHSSLQRRKRKGVKFITDKYNYINSLITTMLDKEDTLTLKSKLFDCFMLEEYKEDLEHRLYIENLQGIDIPLICQALKSPNPFCVMHVGLAHGILLRNRLMQVGFTLVDSDLCIKIDNNDIAISLTIANKSINLTRVPRNISDIIMAFFTNSKLLADLEIEWDEVIDVTKDLVR